MNARVLALVLLAVGLAGAKSAPPLQRKIRIDKNAPVPRAGFAPKHVTDEDVRQLLRDWPVFERAMARLQEVPAASASDDLSGAEVAWAADARIRRALEEAGTSADEFLDVYRRVAQAWWALEETEDREAVAKEMERQIAALREADDAAKAVAELEAGLEKLRRRPGAGAQEVAAVKRHRNELRTIFAP